MLTYLNLSVFVVLLGLFLLFSACEQAPRPVAGSDGDADGDGDTDGDTNSDVELPVNAEGEVERTCETDCTAFPTEPILDEGVSGEPGTLFGAADNFSSPGPCVIEPQLSEGDKPGALLPANWLRPRFKFTAVASADMYEIRLQAASQKNDLVAYTKNTTWVLPSEIWKSMGTTALDEPVTVTIRGVNSASPGTPSGTTGTFTIAPVVAEGKMVYWATTSSETTQTTSWLSGFGVGDEGVVKVLTVPGVSYADILGADGRELSPAEYGAAAGHAKCIGCHTATPDGKAVSFNNHWPWNILISSVEDPETAASAVGSIPSYLTLGAQRLLNQPWLGVQTFSKAYWGSQKLLVTSYGYPRQVVAYNGTVGFTEWTGTTRDTLAWFDLQTPLSIEVEGYNGDKATERNRIINQEAFGTAFGLIALNGESRSAVTPSWSSDGQTIAYTSATNTQDGRLGKDQLDVDIHLVPFNGGEGGTVTSLEGASDPNHAEYYPTFSPDNRLIVFNREENFKQTKTVPPNNVNNGSISIPGSGDKSDIYYRPFAEVYVVESEGGDPLRLAANDPPSCTGQVSPGIINSWGKWSPDVNVSTNYGARRSYYWVVFSSARAYPEQHNLPTTQYSPNDVRSSQLYMSAVVRDEDTGVYTTYPAVYLWNQETESSNLTPAWDNFVIPPVVII